VARAEAVVDDEVKPVLGDEGGLRSETHGPDPTEPRTVEDLS
jgi:hypothetical protein